MADHSDIDISFIIPVSERSEHLRDAIASALNHDYFRAEVIVVDDGPTYQPEEVTRPLSRDFPNVRWFRQEHQGPGAARNLGMSKARGEFVSFLDSDDLIVESAFQELLQVGRAAQSDLICGVPECFRGWRRWVPDVWRDLLNLSAINTCCAEHPVSIRHNLAGGKLYRNDFVRANHLAFPTDVYRGEDWQFTLTSLRFSSRVTFLPRITYRYRKYAQGFQTLSNMVSATLLRDLFTVHARLRVVWSEADTSIMRDLRDSHFLLSTKRHLERFLKSSPPLAERFSLLEEARQFFMTTTPNARAALHTWDRAGIDLIRVGALGSGAAFLTKVSPPSPSQLLLLPEVNDDDEARQSITRCQRALRWHPLIIRATTVFLWQRAKPFIHYLPRLFPRARANALLGWLCSYLWPKSRHTTWIFGERGGYGGDDSSYFFFRWLRQHQPARQSYFIISRGCLHRIPRDLHPWILIRGSFRHYLYLYRACVTVFNFSGNDLAPDWRLLGILRQLPRPRVRAFLNHGVTAIHRVSDHWQFERMKARFDDHDIFTVSSETEKRLFIEHMGHPARNLLVTGITRLDGLYGATPTSSTRKRVLYVPTWRPWLRDGTHEGLCGSRFYAEVFQLLHDPRLHSILKNGGASLTMLTHHVFQPFVKELKELGLSQVQILDMRSEDVQSHLRDSHLLITDYSSISFDFAYMNRPVIFYQFDQDQFFRGRGGFFVDPNHELPGSTVRTRDDLLAEIKKIVARQWKIEPTIEARISSFFDYRDGDNCQRVYNTIIQAMEPEASLKNGDGN